jgi:uncharacterized protein YjbJ (UPF0337 family)
MKNKVKSATNLVIGSIQYLTGRTIGKKSTQMKGISKYVKGKVLSKLN